MVGPLMFQVITKLKRLKRKLKDLNEVYFSDISRRVKMARQKMENAQLHLQSNPTYLDAFRMEKELVQEYSFLRHDEESFLRQKSRINWLKLGDSNSGYFSELLRASITGLELTLSLGRMVLGLWNKRILKKKWWIISGNGTNLAPILLIPI